MLWDVDFYHLLKFFLTNIKKQLLDTETDTLKVFKEVDHKDV